MNDILKLNVGIAGCGTMGLPMLEVLLKNGVNAFGYDVKSKENFPTLKENFISSKVNFFEKSDIIFSAVRDINQTVELCEGKNGLFKVNTQKILIISSTLSPAFLSKLKSYNKYNEKTKAPKIAAALVVGLLIFMKVLRFKKKFQ